MNFLNYFLYLKTTLSPANGKKLPPAPGCVDQQLTALSTDMVHNELDIPQAPAKTPYALQILLDMYRVQYMNMIDQIKSPTYKITVESQISEEKVNFFSIEVIIFFSNIIILL